LDVHGTVKVTDFGFSKIYVAEKLELPVITDLSDGGNITPYNLQLGSPLYMPPERLRIPRAAPDPTADVYSFGTSFIIFSHFQPLSFGSSSLAKSLFWLGKNVTKSIPLRLLSLR
jgi:serine/threonine protein kinase